MTNPLTALPAQFGNRVWIESDGDGPVSTGVITPVVGMVISATNGITVYTTTIDDQGYFSFTVPSGIYTVTYGTVPAGYGAVEPSTVVGAASLSGTKAGAYQDDQDVTHPQDTTVTLAPGETNWNLDFAFTPWDAPELTLTKRASASIVRSGDIVTYTITAANVGSGVAVDVVVIDQLPSAVSYITHTTTSGVYVPLSGEWAIPTVAASSTETLTIMVSVD